MTIKQTVATLIAIFLVTLMSVSALADEVEWREWEEGFNEAGENGKVLLVSVYTDWCGWCRRMDNNTFSDKEIAKTIHKDFVPVKFNPEHDKKYMLDGQEFSGRELLGILTQGQRTGYPTTLFLIVDERRIYMETGYQDANRFAQTLDNILQKEQQHK